MITLANLQNTESPISRAERNKLNGNWEAILENFRHLQRQINILAGTDVEALIKTITDTIDHANQTVMDLIDETTEVTDQKVAEVNAALDNLSTQLTSALQQMETARIEANNAAANANDKANLAQTAADYANAATAEANTATQNTNEAISNAEMATNQANTARDDANSAASAANDAAVSANTAKDNAITATNDAVEATENVIAATSQANEVIGATITATEEANTARDDALQAAQSVINAISIMQADIQATKDAFAHKGEYSASVQYYKDNEVSFDKSTYRAKKDTLGNAPTPLVDNEYWIVVARRGVDGSGAVHSINNQVGDVVLEPSTIGAASEVDLVNLSEMVGEVDQRLTQQLDENTTDEINIKSLGVAGDGTDETNKATTILSSTENKSLLFPYSETGFVLNEVVIPMQKQLNGRLTKIEVKQQDKRAFHFSNNTKFIYDPKVSNFEFKQPLSSSPGDGMANNHASISFLGTINAKSVFNAFRDVALGITFQYGAIGLPDRQGKHNLAAFNLFDKVEKMTIENIGTAYNRIVGNGIDGKGSTSHGIRITGYGSDSINTPAEGVVSVANVINGMTNAYSLQNTAKFNSIGISSTKDITESLVDLRPPTNVANTVEFNSLLGMTFKNVKRVITNDEGQYNEFHFIGKDVTGDAISEIGGADYGVDGHNKYSGIVKNVTGYGAMIRQKKTRLDLDLINVNGKGITLAVGADGATGNISVDKADMGVEILSSFNLLNLHVTNCTETSGRSIVVGGTGNVIHLYTDKNVTLSGNNNTLIGYVGGTITVIAGSGTHNITGVKGYSTRKQEINKTTDATGKVTIQHGLKTDKLVPSVIVFGATNVSCKVSNLNTTDLVVEFRNYDGTSYANQTVSFMWSLEAF